MQNGFKTALNNGRLICLLAVVFLLSAAYLFSRYEITDDAFFGGDSWEYQSLGVNLSLGHGMKFGGIEAFEDYKFSDKSPSPEYYERCFEKFNGQSKYDFHRAPGYPFFLAFIYKIFGVHPAYVKIIQVLLLALTAAIIPVIGLYYWSTCGVAGGLLSSVLFLFFYCPKPNLIMTESLLTFSVILWALMFIYWEHSPTKSKTFLLGISCLLMLYIKGVTIFLPMIILLYLAVKFRNKWKKAVVYAFIFITGYFFFSIPWSMYALQKSGRFIFVSTQGSGIILDGNNEDSFTHGGWNPRHAIEEKDNTAYLYNRLENKNLSSVEKLFIFLIEYKEKIPLMLKNKLVAGFNKKSILLSLSGMFLYYLLMLLSAYGEKNSRFALPALNPHGRFPTFPIIFLVNILLITLILFGKHRFVMPFSFAFALPATYTLFYLTRLVLDRLNIAKRSGAKA